MNIVYKCAATPKFLVVLRHCMALFFGWSPMQDTNERRIRSFNFRGRAGKHAWPQQCSASDEQASPTRFECNFLPNCPKPTQVYVYITLHVLSLSPATRSSRVTWWSLRKWKLCSLGKHDGPTGIGSDGEALIQAKTGMAVPVRLARRKNSGKHVWNLQFHCTGFFIYHVQFHVYLFIYSLFSCKIQNSKKISRHLHEGLNLDEIKNTLHSLPVNRETNLINIIRP